MEMVITERKLLRVLFLVGYGQPLNNAQTWKDLAEVFPQEYSLCVRAVLIQVCLSILPSIAHFSQNWLISLDIGPPSYGLSCKITIVCQSVTFAFFSEMAH